MTRIACFLLLAGGLTACEPPGEPIHPPDRQAHPSPIEVTEGWARPVTRTEGATVNSAAYFNLVNRSAEPLALVGAHAQAAAWTEIHETRIEDGVMRMRSAAEVDLPAGAERRFEPGGLHVMLMDVQRDLAAGDSLELVLQFGDGTEHATWLVVRPATL